MRVLVLSALTLLYAALAGATPAAAGSANDRRTTVSASAELSSQQQRRTRPRITVTPRGGGRLVRECDFRLVREVRASGTYVVPWQRCWWARQR